MKKSQGEKALEAKVMSNKEAQKEAIKTKSEVIFRTEEGFFGTAEPCGCILFGNNEGGTWKESCSIEHF